MSNLIKPQIIFYLFSFLSVGLLTGCGDKTVAVANKSVIHPAKIFQVKNPKANNFRDFPAKVEANTTSKLAFRVSGQVVNFPVKAGNMVKKGQLLVKLDPKDFQLRVDDRTARYQLARSQFDRARSLLVKKLISQSKFDEAKANLSVALSALNSAKIDFGYTKLVAPFAGSIANVMVKNHENIQAKQAILTLQSSDMMDISIQIPESIFSRVKKGTHYQPTVVFDSHPKQKFLVSIKEWDTQANLSTLTYKVVFSLPTPKTFNVLPGMSASVSVDLSKVTNSDQALFLIPVSAIFSPENISLKSQANYVWKVDLKTMKVSRQQVTIGQITDAGVEVLQGLKTGDSIISAGVHYLAEGMQVKSWHREKGL